MSVDSFAYLLEELLFSDATNRLLDYLFYAGVGIGAFKLVQYAWPVVPAVYTYCLSRLFTPIPLKEKFGQWAVITGATSSLGVAFAKELAGRGFDVVLISRSYDNLINLVSDIQSQYSVQAYGIHADFFLGQTVFNEIEEALLTDKLDIGILVNVNPIKYDHPQYFTQIPTLRLWQIINVNIASTTMMTHIILPSMLERGRGAVINISSAIGSFPPTPLLSLEAASMSFMNMFGQSLHEECQRKNIVIQTLTPLFLHKEGCGDHTLLCPTHQTYVRNALSTLTYRSYCSGYLPHALLSSLYQLLPFSLWVWLANSYNRAERRKCLSSQITHDGRLFARRPHRVSIVHQNNLRLSRAPLSPPILEVPYKSDDEDLYHRPPPTLQRHYSKVTVVPSLVTQQMPAPATPSSLTTPPIKE